MRTPLIAGNWKMNTTVREAITLVENMLRDLDSIQNVEKLLCPPYISLNAIKEIISGSSVQLGAQNMYFKEKGAYTGEISPVMLKDLCTYVVLGHSERRQYFNETDAMINNKVKSAIQFGITPILCVGESLEENEKGKTREIVTRQVKAGLEEVEAGNVVVIAYEPVWAIGTGKAATGKQANDTIGMIRSTLHNIWNKNSADMTRLLYGGSVTGENIAEYIAEPDIDGALVGGASLKPEDFMAITRRTAELKAGK
jgi:triosephosphate isomerase